MTYLQAEQAFENYELEDAYAAFIMDNGNRSVCNGDDLTELMESGYLCDEFLLSLVTEEV